MQVFYSKDGKLKFEILEDSVFIKHNNDIYEICEGDNRLTITKNGKDVKPKKKLPKIKKTIVDPYLREYENFTKSEFADG